MATDTDETEVGDELLKKNQRDAGFCSKLSLDRKWLVLSVCFLCNFLVYGCITSFGVFLPEILNLYGGKKSVAVWIGSLEVGMLFLIGPLATYLIHRLGYRLVVIGGSILACGGFIFSVFTVNIYSMYITFGIMIGSGGGLISASSVVALHDYFPNNFATASGVVFAGGAIGLTLYPIFVDKLQTFYGFKMSLLIHSGLFLNCAVCGAVMKPLYLEKSNKDYSKLDLTILGNKLFILNGVGAIFNTVGYYIPIFFLTEFAIFRNFTKIEGAFLVTLHGVSAIFARPFFGWLTDRKCVNKLTFYAVLPLLEAVVVACLPSSGNHYWILIMLSILNGILGMPFTSMIAAVLSDLFGPKKLPTAYGLWSLANGVGILIGPPVAAMYTSEIKSKVTFVDDISPEILKETAATALVDGKSLLGAVVGHFCIDLAIEKAKKCGVGWVCTRGSNHFGIAGYYSTRAMEQGMLGLAFTSTAPALVPTRAKHRTIGTNPLSLAAPGNNDDSFILDMATTSVARGKADILAMKNQPMPLGWAVDEEGKETYDPNNFAGLQPLGGKEESSGYKGYGLSMMVEILCGVLSGGAFGPFVREYMHHENPANLGQCFIAVNLDAFADGFQDRLSTLMNHCRNLEPAEDGKFVCVPGDPEKKHGEKVKELGGIPYLPRQIERMNAIAKEVGVEAIRTIKTCK